MVYALSRPVRALGEEEQRTTQEWFDDKTLPFLYLCTFRGGGRGEGRFSFVLTLFGGGGGRRDPPSSAMRTGGEDNKLRKDYRSHRHVKSITHQHDPYQKQRSNSVYLGLFAFAHSHLVSCRLFFYNAHSRSTAQSNSVPTLMAGVIWDSSVSPAPRQRTLYAAV